MPSSGHFDEGVFAGFEALVDGVAEDAARRSPGLKIDVRRLVGLFARHVDTDVVEHPVAVFDLRAKEPEARLALIGGAHEEFGLRSREAQGRMRVGDFQGLLAPE